MEFKFKAVKTITDPVERRQRLAKFFEIFEQQKNPSETDSEADSSVAENKSNQNQPKK